MMNPIEQRLDKIESLWNEVAETREMRLCRWLVDSDEIPMLEAFLEYQNEEGSTAPDLFFSFVTPFDEPRRYGFELARLFFEQYEKSRDGLRQAGIFADWLPPDPGPNQSDVEFFGHACRLFQSRYNEIVPIFVVALFPASICDIQAWQIWLAGFIKACGEKVRGWALDRAGEPDLEPLVEAQGKSIVTLRPSLDMPSAYIDLARGGPPSPGAALRLNFVAMTQASKKGDSQSAAELGQRALAIAQAQNWPQMQVVIHMSIAASQLAQPNGSQKAIGSYRAAADAAGTATRSGDPVGPRLLVTARLGEAAALVSEAAFAEAAGKYEAIVPVAQGAGDLAMTLESWRMAGYCHEQCGDLSAAWRCGNKALEVGGQMKEDQRNNSTLVYAGRALLRVVHPQREREDPGPELKAKINALNDTMTRLAGPNWLTESREKEIAR
jgi:hypothetical protein